MKAPKLTTAAVVALSVMSQSFIGVSAARAEAPKTKNVQNDSLNLSREVFRFRAAIDSGSMTLSQAAEELMNRLYEKEVTLDQVYSYVEFQTSPEEFVVFKGKVDSVLRSTRTDSLASLTPSERERVIGMALAATQQQGAAWSGCAGATIGVILLVAAVTVGIIAIVKSAGEARIKNRYTNKKQDRTDRFLRDKNEIINKKQNIETRISNYTQQIQQNNSQISYWMGVATGSSSLEAKNDALARVKYYQDQNTHLQGEIGKLNLELAQYSNQEYVNSRIAQLTVSYNTDMAQLEADEANAIKLVPQNQRLAKGMGIGAGAGLAVGAYLTIDGFSSCN